MCLSVVFFAAGFLHFFIRREQRRQLLFYDYELISAIIGRTYQALLPRLVLHLQILSRIPSLFVIAVG